jgi:hypothetical protein
MIPKPQRCRPDAGAINPNMKKTNRQMDGQSRVQPFSGTDGQSVGHFACLPVIWRPRVRRSIRTPCIGALRGGIADELTRWNPLIIERVHR